MRPFSISLRYISTAIELNTKLVNNNSKTPKTLILTKSPILSDAKRAFDSLISSSSPAATKLTSGSDRDALRLHNSLLQSYASISATLSDSVSLLRHMVKSSPNFSPDRSTYHILLSQSCVAPDDTLSTVHSALNLMSDVGFAPDKVSADIAVRSLVSAGRMDSALQLFDEMSQKHSAPDAYTYNFLVKSLCKCKPLSFVYAFMEKIRSSYGLKPDIVTYTILIDNVCNSKNLREMTRLVSVLEEEGFKPDCFLYNTIMKGYCMMDLGSEVVKVYRKMKEKGVKPDVISYNTLIFGMSKSGRAREGRKYLDVMESEGHVPDVVTYTALMNGLFRERDVSGAWALLAEMKSKGCEPNSCTYNTLLHGFCKARLVERAMELFRVMKEESMEIESVSYEVMVRMLCRSGKVAEAYEVFDYVVQSKSLTDVAAFTTLESTLGALNMARKRGNSN